MWRKLEIITLIAVLLLNATQSQMISKQQTYTMCIHEFKLPTSEENTYIAAKPGILTLKSCAMICLDKEDCDVFCFDSGTCVLKRPTGNFEIFSSDTIEENSQKTFVCYMNQKIKSGAPETIVKALNIENVALRKPASASSALTVYQAANLAVDGNLASTYGMGYCQSTKGDDLAWILIDLTDMYFVHYINITFCDIANCADLFHDAEVRVGMNKGTQIGLADSFTQNTLCAEYIDHEDVYWFTPCLPKPIYGQIITVQIVRNYNIEKTKLSVCEVQVYALTS